jgi:hypothetical protein
MKLKLTKLKIFGVKVLRLCSLAWLGCQPLLSDRHQIDIIRLTLWQEANSPPHQFV